MNIDLSKFTAPETDGRTYLHSVLRHDGRLYASDGSVIITIPDDGRAADEASETVAEAFLRVTRLPDALPDGIALSTIKLPNVRAECLACEGSGTVRRRECDDCDGEGHFEHGRHEYECYECDGAGYTEAPRGPDRCPNCSGTGAKSLEAIQVRDALIDLRFLLLLRDLPNCVLHPTGPFTTAIIVFDGGHGAVMPMRAPESPYRTGP